MVPGGFAADADDGGDVDPLGTVVTYHPRHHGYRAGVLRQLGGGVPASTVLLLLAATASGGARRDLQQRAREVRRSRTGCGD